MQAGGPDARELRRVEVVLASSDQPALVWLAVEEAESEPERESEPDDDSEQDDSEREEALLAARDAAVLVSFAPRTLKMPRPDPERCRSRALEPETPPPRA